MTNLASDDRCDLGHAKLLLLVPVLDFGGVESRIAIQAENMRDQVGELRVCTFWKPGATADRLRTLGIPVDVLEVSPSIRNLRATVLLARYLRRHKPDILHSGIGEANWHGLLAGAFVGVPMRIVEEVGIPARSGLTRRAFPWLYRLAHRIIGVSQVTCDFLIGPDGAAPEKVRLVYNSADASFFEDPPPARRPPGSPFRVLAVGRLDPIKNQAMLIRAFSRVHERAPESELWIAGEGPSRSELEALLVALDLSDSVRLLGFREDVRGLLGDADLFVLPSHSEGFGITLVEAMACEVPVLASNVGGAEEVMGDLGQDYLLSPTDEAGWAAAIEGMVAMDDEGRRALGRRGREIVIERFSPETYLSRLESLYEEVLLQQRRVK